MTIFQILTVIISSLVLLGSIIGVHFAGQLAIAKIEVEILHINKEILAIRLDFGGYVKDNKEDHKDFFKKIKR